MDLPSPSVSPSVEPSAPPVALQPRPLTKNEARLFGALGTFQAIAAILAIRLIIALACLGAFILGLNANSILGIITLTTYGLLVVVPLVWLDHTTRRGAQ